VFAGTGRVSQRHLREGHSVPYNCDRAEMKRHAQLLLELLGTGAKLRITAHIERLMVAGGDVAKWTELYREVRRLSNGETDPADTSTNLGRYPRWPADVTIDSRRR
jgi:hypothetical protein